jgi:hypothetical protein
MYGMLVAPALRFTHGRWAKDGVTETVDFCVWLAFLPMADGRPAMGLWFDPQRVRSVRRRSRSIALAMRLRRDHWARLAAGEIGSSCLELR